MKGVMNRALLVGVALALLLASAIAEEIVASEVTYRLIVAERNRAWISHHNSKEGRSFTMKAYDQFVGQTIEELSSKLLIKMPMGDQHNSGKVLVKSPRPSSPGLLSYLPTVHYRNVNWTERGMVSQVKQQGNCGSCYAFAAIADIESSYLLKGKSVDLSEKQVIDCSQAFGNQGCNGGWMAQVFAFAMLKGLVSEDKYPMTNQTLRQGVQGSCLYPKGQFKIRSYSYTSIRQYDCQSLVRIVEKRPVTVTIAADVNFFFYWSGILNQCGEEINHGVLLTGVYEDEKTNFWMVKNSWGSWWGMQGFANIDRYSRYGNLCEICYAPSYSLL